MLEILLRDNGIGFEFLVIRDDEVEYRLKTRSQLDSIRTGRYSKLKDGTIILNGQQPLSVYSVEENQIEYIKEIMTGLEKKVKEYKNNHKSLILEYMDACEYLENFCNEYNKVKNSEFNVEKKDESESNNNNFYFVDPMIINAYYNGQITKDYFNKYCDEQKSKQNVRNKIR